MTTYLHFDLGSRRDAYEDVLAEIRKHAAKPSELILTNGNANRYTICAPIRMKSELETLFSNIGRRVDLRDYDPCTIELRHVLAEISPDGELVTAPAVNGIWHSANTKYVPTEPRDAPTSHRQDSEERHPPGSSVGGT